MAENDGLKPLRVALVLIGIVFLIGLYPLTVFWPSGWIWTLGGHSDYLQMIMGIYATLGVFLILAARNPLENLSLIWFTVWSSVVHGVIMAAQAWVYPEHRGHLLGDVPALFVVALVLAILTPKGEKARMLQRV
jgi:formate hydrogenlyase subunit 3/multisubunit Na+/H+ antiporter MnhD subunit